MSFAFLFLLFSLRVSVFACMLVLTSAIGKLDKLEKVADESER